PFGKKAIAHGWTSASVNVTTRIRACSVANTEGSDNARPARSPAAGALRGRREELAPERSSTNAAPSPTSATSAGTIRRLIAWSRGDSVRTRKSLEYRQKAFRSRCQNKHI